MGNESRTANSIRNSSMSAVAQIVSVVLNFIGRTFFIKYLNIDYLGVNGLFTNILTLLSLAELGVGTSIVYMMYSPIAKGDTYKVAAFNNLFRKIYNIIGCFVFTVGLLLIPFLNDIIKDVPNIKENLSIIYVLFLANTSISYFFTYKRSLLIAHQKDYLNSKNVIKFAIIKDIVIVLILLLTRNYYLYLFAQIFITFLSNWTISRLADKLFPEIVNIKDAKITQDEKKSIFKNTMGMMCHKIGSVVVSGTDNILISSFVGLSTVGVYSNYQLIQKVALQIISQGVNAVTASVGNLVATCDRTKVFSVYKNLYFLNFTLAYFMAAMFYSLIDSFISIWIGDTFIINEWAMLVIAINLFFNQIRVPSQVIINSYGVFWEVKWKSIVEAIVNLSFSLIFTLVFEWGLTGILLGTIVSNITTNLWWEPYAAFRYGMHQPVILYIRFFIRDCFIFAITLLLIRVESKFLSTLIDENYLFFLFQFIISFIIAVAIYLLVYYKNEGFNFLISNFRKTIRI